MDGVGVESPLEGTLLIIKNNDQPGVIGNVGTLLGRHRVNIASFALGRDPECVDCAVGVVNVDEHPERAPGGSVTDPVLAEIRAITEHPIRCGGSGWTLSGFRGFHGSAKAFTVRLKPDTDVLRKAKADFGAVSIAKHDRFRIDLGDRVAAGDRVAFAHKIHLSIAGNHRRPPHAVGRLFSRHAVQRESRRQRNCGSGQRNGRRRG